MSAIKIIKYFCYILINSISWEHAGKNTGIKHINFCTDTKFVFPYVICIGFLIKAMKNCLVSFQVRQ